MNCEEFRREYQSLLDLRHPDDLSRECAAHVTGCRSCANFAAAIRGVDRAQREQPRVSIPASLLADLLAIPLAEMRKEITIRRYAGKAAAIILPGAGLLTLGMLLLSPGPLFWLRLGVLTAGFTLFWISVLTRPPQLPSVEEGVPR